jgi:hypothetical protein
VAWSPRRGGVGVTSYSRSKIGHVQLLPLRPWNAPRHRFRGKKKYFRRVLRDAEVFRLATGPGCWWDHWHQHVDWPGWGNLSRKYRLAHVRALAIIFRKVVEATLEHPTPFQAWIFLDDDDAGQDAVYVHSPNPNSSNFPFRPDATWAADEDPLHEMMTALLPGLSLRIGRCTGRTQDDERGPREYTLFFVYSPGVGVALERGQDTPHGMG